MDRFTRSKNYIPLPEHVNDTAKQTIDAAFYVHTKLGPCLPEHMYGQSLTYILKKKGLDVKTQVSIPVYIDELKLNGNLRLDMLVQDCLIVELKAVKELHEYYRSQLLSYLSLTGIRLGLLINFGEPHLKNGIYRLIK